VPNSEQSAAMDGQPKRIKTKDAADMLGVTPRTVQALAGKGELPGAARIGGLWTFDPKKLAKFIAEKEAEIAARAAWKPPTPAWKTGCIEPRSNSTKAEKAYALAMEKLRNAGKLPSPKGTKR
jgi:phage terminase Nu1 subunit (DNA packaging protein)